MSQNGQRDLIAPVDMPMTTLMFLIHMSDFMFRQNLVKHPCAKEKIVFIVDTTIKIHRAHIFQYVNKVWGHVDRI